MSCVNPDPANTVTDRMGQLLTSGGNGYVLSLCPGRQYFITRPINFTAPNQEISTQGYPTGNDRATLVVSGPVFNGTGHTTAVDGTCNSCSGLKLRNVQVCSYRREASRLGQVEKCLTRSTGRGPAPRLLKEAPTLRWVVATLDNWWANSLNLQSVDLSGIVFRSNSSARSTPARGLVFTLPKGHSPALAQSFRTTTLVHVAPTRSKSGLMVSASVVPTASSETIPSPTRRMGALSSSLRVVSSRTTRSLYKTWVTSFDRKAYVSDVSFSQATCLGGINLVDYDPWSTCYLFSVWSLAYLRRQRPTTPTLLSGITSSMADSHPTFKTLPTRLKVRTKRMPLSSQSQGSEFSSPHTKKIFCTGSVLRSDPELGLVTDTSRTSASLVQSSVTTFLARSGMPWPSPLPVISPFKTTFCSGTRALSDPEVQTARLLIPLPHPSLLWLTTITPTV